jgi:hypothetical protein
MPTDPLATYHRIQTSRAAHALNMASATGIPATRNTSEEEPLLGRRGDASQPEGTSIWWNLWIGTAPIAQAGIWILAAIVWGAILSKKLIFFSAHPVCSSPALLFYLESKTKSTDTRGMYSC